MVGKDIRFFEEVPVWGDPARLFTADFLRWHVVHARYDRDDRVSYADLGRELGLSDEFVRNVLNGTREPSKAFLEATGYERVVLYRKKGRMASSETTSKAAPLLPETGEKG